MTSFDILITKCSTTPLIIQSLSDFLTKHKYTLTHNKSETYWIWLPVIENEKSKCPDDILNPDLIVIPILLDNVTCPDWFSSRYAIEIPDSTDDLQPYFDELYDRLIKAKPLVDKLRSLEIKYKKLNNNIKHPRLSKYLELLQTQMGFIRDVIQQPQITHNINQQAIVAGIQTLLDKPEITQGTDNNYPRIIGNPPQGQSERFKGRENELASISNYILDHTQTRIISILGQGGVGKTALACQALDSLSQHDNIHSILYLSAESRNQQFTLERLFMMTGEAFGDDVREMLDRVWKNEQMALETRVDYLIDQFVDERCLLLFDNLEDSLTDNGHFLDDKFTQFFRQFLNREHQATIIMTSRTPILLDDERLSVSKIIPLSAGLSRNYALELLYDFDADGSMGLKQADINMLYKVIKLTQGFPRALEAVAGILANRPRVTLADLTQFDIDPDNRIADWVNRAEEVLDDDQRMVMQALAIFARPVGEVAIRFLLDPYVEVTGIDIPFTLDKLQRGRYITRNYITGDISIHPLDKDYNYNLIKEGESDVGMLSAGERFLLQLNILPPVAEEPDTDLFTRLTLEKRAADYYAQLRGQPSDWHTIHDLQSYFSEYEHRLRANDYETSFTMLITIYNLLKLSGFSRKIVEMITSLIDYLSDTYLMTCYNMLGMAYDDLGKYQDALNCHQTALPLARDEENRPAEAAHLSGIGLQYSNLGEYEKALEHYDQALEISREEGRRKQERGILNNMAVVYNSIGRKLEGLSYYEQSLEIARDIDDQQGIAVTLANIGDSYGSLGDVDKTIECYQESIEMYNEIGDKLGRGVTIGKMGNAAIMLGSYDDALKLLNVAVGIAQAVGNRMWDVLHQADIAAVYAHQGNIDKGIDVLEQLVPQAKEIGSPILINYTHSLMAGVLLYAGEFHQAAEASRMAIQYVNPANQHYEYALYGLILVRLNHFDAAQDAFNSALDHAAELLENTPNLYSPKYSRGLALMGLALITKDMTYAEDAKDAYIEARENCDAKGIVSREMKKLKLLTGSIDEDDDNNLWLLDKTDD